MTPARVRPCRNCSAVLSLGYKGERCPFCLMPMNELAVPVKKSKRQRKRERQARRFNEPATFRDRGRQIAREDEPSTILPADRWITAHPGNPLGAGMPLGATLREDGESHVEAWMRLVRADPCSYCDAEGGTVDHIEPRSLRKRGLHNWTNFAGACQSCNESKAARPLLLFLAYRGIKRRDDQRQRRERRDGR